MENEKVTLDKISPYVKKPFVTKNALLNILLFIILFCINAFGQIKEFALPLSNINPPWLIFHTLGFMSVSVLIGYGISSLFNKGKERGIKAKYGFLIAIAISIALLINDLERIKEKKEQQINSAGDRASFPTIAIKNDKYYSEDGKYSIAFPKSPKNSTREINMNETGGQIVHSSIVETGDDTFSVYFVDISDFEKMSNDEIKKEFISLRDSSIKNINGRLIHSNYFNFNSTSKKDCIGYDFSADYQNSNNENCIYIARALIVKSRLYTIIVKTLKNEGFEKKVDFVNSFNCFY